MAYRGTSLTFLADPTRLRIFERLADGRISVGDLAGGFPISRPAISQHLGVLKDGGLVCEHRAGTRRLYELDLDGVGSLRDYFQHILLRAQNSKPTAEDATGEARGKSLAIAVPGPTASSVQKSDVRIREPEPKRATTEASVRANGGGYQVVMDLILDVLPKVGERMFRDDLLDIVAARLGATAITKKVRSFINHAIAHGVRTRVLQTDYKWIEVWRVSRW